MWMQLVYSLLLLNVVIVNACTCYSLLQFVSLLSLMVLLLAYWYVVNIAVSCHYHIYSSTVDLSLLLFPCVVSLVLLVADIVLDGFAITYVVDVHSSPHTLR